MTDRKIIETMSQAECEAAEWADMLDMCREERDAALARVAELEAQAAQVRFCAAIPPTSQEPTP